MLEKFLKAWCSHSFKSLLWVSICAFSYREQARQDEADQEQSYLLSWDEWEVGCRHLQTLWQLSERDNGINLAEPMSGSYVNKVHKGNECVTQNPEQQPQSEEAQSLAAHAPNTDNACYVPTDLRLREIQAYKAHDEL